jgi:outer membrane protein OmpA-like peptidoglycan-associated protein
MSKWNLVMSHIRMSIGRAALLACLGLAWGLTPALSQSNADASAAALIEALKSKSTRGVTAPASAEQLAADRKASELIESLKSKVSRGLSASTQERAALAEVVRAKPNANLEIPFEFNSAELAPAAITSLNTLGKALQDGQISAADMLVAGHTDAKGRPNYNQSLSQRRAEAVKDYLVKNFQIPAKQLIPVGYGQEKLKNTTDPYSDENRRVQVVNLTN